MNSDVTISRMFLDSLEDKLTRLQGVLSGGNVKDYPEYREIVGEIRGLIRAKQEFVEAVAKSQRDDLANEVEDDR